MKIQRILIGLTLVNLGLSVFLLTQIQAEARGVGAGGVETTIPGPAPILRGRELEIVDDQGKARATIKIHSADPNFKMPDGTTGYPETVMFRLIDPNGRPEVKLGASVQGAGLGLVGETDTTHVLLQAEGADTSLKLTNKTGQQELITP